MDLRIFIASLAVIVAGSSCANSASLLRWSSFSVTMVVKFEFNSKRMSMVEGDSGTGYI